MYVIGGQLAAP